jgi:hypothetical protein
LYAMPPLGIFPQPQKSRSFNSEGYVKQNAVEVGRKLTAGERNNVVDSGLSVSLQSPRATNILVFMLIIQEIRNSSD